MSLFPPFSSSILVHERHGALRLAVNDLGEKLQSQTHVDGHEHVRGVDHHGNGGEEDRVKDGLLPRLQDVDAGDEQVLVVQPGQVLPHVFEAHPASWGVGKQRWGLNKRREMESEVAWMGFYSWNCNISSDCK